jgi:hypothetical protein
MQTNFLDYSSLNYRLNQLPAKERTKNNLWRAVFNSAIIASELDKAIDDFWKQRYPKKYAIIEGVDITDNRTSYKVLIFDGKGIKTFSSNSNAAGRLFANGILKPKQKGSGGLTEKQAEKALLEEALYAN